MLQGMQPEHPFVIYREKVAANQHIMSPLEFEYVIVVSGIDALSAAGH
jgi:hypothetical protein